MKKLYILIYCFLSIFSIDTSAEVRILFVNGIDNIEKEAIASEARLKEVIGNNVALATKLNQQVGGVKGAVHHWYNQTHGRLNDIDELGIQAHIMARALTFAKAINPNATPQSPIYKIELGKIYAAANYYPIEHDKSDIDHVYEGVLALAVEIDNFISSGHQVIVVAHSQGNYFAEAADALLRNGRSAAANKVWDDNLRFVGAGSVAASTPNSRYVTLVEDKAVFAHRVLNKSKINFTVLPNNEILCPGDVNTRTDCVIDKEGIDLEVHDFIKIYLSYRHLGIISGKTIAQIIVGYINESFDELTISLNAAPEVPTPPALTFVSKTSSSISLQWTVPANATDYVLTRSGTSSNRTGSSIVDYSLLPNTTYSYSIKACNVAGCSSESNIVNVTTDAVALLAPTPPTLTLVSKSSSSVSLQWNVPATATYFVLNRSGTVTNRTGSSFVDIGLSSATAYSYSLQACNATGCSGSSNIQNVTTDAAAVVARCTGQWTTGQYNIGQAEQQTQACSVGYTGNIFLSHTCQAGTAGSTTGIWGVTNTQNNCVVAPPVTCLGTWSTIRYAVGQTEEQFSNSCPAGTQGQVRTFHTCQASGSWSANAQSDSCVATLVAPTGLSASSVSAAQNGVAGIRLVWTAVSGATRYYITRNGSANYSSQVGTNWTDPNAIAGVQYCYTVNAFSSFNNGTSAESSQVCTTYQPTQVSVSPPTNVAAARYTTGGRKDILLTWTPPSPAPDSYQVFRRDRSGMLAPLGGADTSFLDRYELNLTSGISYCYFIRSEKGGVISTESNEACSLAP
jgi:hypothetical protein